MQTREKASKLPTRMLIRITAGVGGRINHEIYVSRLSRYPAVLELMEGGVQVVDLSLINKLVNNPLASTLSRSLEPCLEQD
jgi:hypothetical protein